jgi:hypothetical protein
VLTPPMEPSPGSIGKEIALGVLHKEAPLSPAVAAVAYGEINQNQNNDEVINGRGGSCAYL